MKRIFQSILCFCASFFCIIEFQHYLNDFDKYNLFAIVGSMLFAIAGLYLFFTNISNDDEQ